MSSGSRLSSGVLEARERLARCRAKMEKQHAAGSPGVQVCTLFTSQLEEILLDLFRFSLDELGPAACREMSPAVAVVAHSGFGRREMAPFSDVDLMVLHPFRNADTVLPLVRRFTQNIYDLGLDLGFSARSLAEACRLALDDATIFTSLSAGRLIAGNEQLYQDFDTRFRRQTRAHWRSLLSLVTNARQEESRTFGETVFLLEPNIKRSRGGLRDLQLVGWVGAARYGETDPELLMRSGHLPKEDWQRLRRAREFLLWLRNDLHFHAGKANDLLDRSEQLRIAGLRNHPPEDGLMPVEQFMREYFDHTTGVREIAAHFVASASPRATLRRWMEPLLGHRVEDDFLVGPHEITANAQGLAKLRQGDLAEVLRLLDLANYYDKRIEHETWRTIRAAMVGLPPADPHQPLPPTIAERFLSLMSQPTRLSDLLRWLHELRVLEQIVPGMGHTRGLLQFNAYHYYTVDEHSLRAVDCVTRLQADTGLPGQLYRGLKLKRTLHLAVLIHDLGKGFVEDHSDVGQRLAAALATRLGMPERETETLKFLVLKHLRMSHLAQQHDIHDEHVVVPFAVEVGTPENLQMLYLLTLADLAAVGPGVLNQWKQELLTDLYQHTLQLLVSDSPADARNQRILYRREELRKLVAARGESAWWRTQIAALPSSLLFAGPPGQLVAELEKLHTLPHQEAIAWGRFLPERNVVEYTVGAYEEITPGIFHKLTGALTSQRHQILSAAINTLAEGMVFDRFYVVDQDFQGQPPDERLAQVSAALVAALNSGDDKPPSFTRRWQDRAEVAAAIKHLPTQVTIDNSTSERDTILNIFAYDRMGLLYAITRTLFELDLSVNIAKIGTHLDQVVDVFYVNDKKGGKVTNEERLAVIRQRLLEAIERVESSPL